MTAPAEKPSFHSYQQIIILLPPVNNSMTHLGVYVVLQPQCHMHDVLVIAGDWNTDTQHSRSFTDIIHSFLSELNLSFADLNYAHQIGFTYLDHNGSKSWLDHVAVFSRFLPSISNIHGINDDRNLSDHNPLVCCMDSSCAVVDYRSSPVTEPTARAWYKANSDHISRYQSLVGH